MQEKDTTTEVFEPVLFVNISRNNIYTVTPGEELMEIYSIIARQWNLDINNCNHLLIIDKILLKSIKFN